ncbi:hypothetical protein GCM10009605_31040 [Nocardiopsis composta]
MGAAGDPQGGHVRSGSAGKGRGDSRPTGGCMLVVTELLSHRVATPHAGRLPTGTCVVIVVCECFDVGAGSRVAVDRAGNGLSGGDACALARVGRRPLVPKELKTSIRQGRYHTAVAYS